MILPVDLVMQVHLSIHPLNIPSTSNKSNVMLVSIYRKQEIDCGTFCNEFERFIDRIFDLCDSIILTGDFNVWADVDDRTDTVKLMNLINAYGLFQVIREPTQEWTHTGSCDIARSPAD